MLEDDSGRVRLVGDVLNNIPLVTGCIIAVMGTENTNGEFEVIDLKVPDLAPQPERWALSKPPTASGKSEGEDTEMTDSPSQSSGKKIAIVSGLAFSGTDASYDLELDLLLEYLLGEALGPDEQTNASQISRLIIAGNSISTVKEKDDDEGGEDDDEKKTVQKKYGYDASAYNPVPSQLFDQFVSELLPSIPVTLLPGAQDPANASYPQQPVHSAMFPLSRAYAAELGTKAASQPGWFDPVTNPWEAEVEGWRILGTGGQNVDDVFKYVESDDRLGMMEAMCRWRCCAPTAPDTLCMPSLPSLRCHFYASLLFFFLSCGKILMKLFLGSYPFQEDDPFVLKTCPHVYFVGCQPEFATKVIHGPDGQSVRLIAVPSFSKTKEFVLMDTETLEVTRVKIASR